MNARVTYPIKYELCDLHNDNIIEMEDDVTKAIVSIIAMDASGIGIPTVIESWNEHPIPGNIVTKHFNVLLSFRFSNMSMSYRYFMSTKTMACVI